MPNYQKHIVYLSDEQRQELFTNGSITVNGQTVAYSDNDMYVTPQEAPVTDVQVDGTSVTQDGVADIPIAYNKLGAVKVSNNIHGISIVDSTGEIKLTDIDIGDIKQGTRQRRAISPYYQHESTFYGLAKAAGDTTQSQSANAVGQYTDNAKTAIREMLDTAASDIVAVQDTKPTSSTNKVWLDELHKSSVQVPTVAEMNTALEGKIGDVQINGSSIVQNGIANVPIASSSTLGVVKTDSQMGITQLLSGMLYIAKPIESEIKAGTASYRPITPIQQHISVFYGLAKAAGDTTQSQSVNAVGIYTDEAKSAIQSMLGIDLQSIASEVEIPLAETVTGTVPTITGQPNTRYVCGEVSTISITPPESGSIDVIFTSGTTAAVLTIPNTVKMPEWFDATALDSNTIYEILITDGIYGSVMTWPA